MQQQLEDPAREPEPPLGGLVQSVAVPMTSECPAEPHRIERSGQHLDDVGLDQDALLERLPRGHRLDAAAPRRSMA